MLHRVDKNPQNAPGAFVVWVVIFRSRNCLVQGVGLRIDLAGSMLSSNGWMLPTLMEGPVEEYKHQHAM